MARVLIVDDEPRMRDTLSQILTLSGHEPRAVDCVEAALTALDDEEYDVIVSDIVMPGLSGVDLLEAVRERRARSKVVLITGDPSAETAAEAVRKGAVDYITKPVKRERLAKIVTDAARLKRLEDENRRYREELEELVAARTRELAQSEHRFRELVIKNADGIVATSEAGEILMVNPAAEELMGRPASALLGTPLGLPINPDEPSEVDIHVPGCQPVSIELHTSTINLAGEPAFLASLRDVTARKQVEVERAEHLARFKKLLEDTARALSLAMEMRDPYTAGHQRRVTQLSLALGEALGFDESQLSGLRVTGLLHDLGKLNIPASILSRPSRLTDAELDLIKGHAESAYEILKEIDFPWPVAQAVLQHHERLDGSGYPRGLSGDEIRLEARILAVADVVEAMSSHRPYRPAHGVDHALAHVQRYRGVRFDEQVTDACLKLFEDGFIFED
jgi:putative nucleotidyltransferase with HDIG domain